MNWRITTDSRHLANAEPEVELAEGEDAKPSQTLVNSARQAARDIASKLEGSAHIEVHAHETTEGRGFRPGHVIVTVSKLRQ